MTIFAGKLKYNRDVYDYRTDAHRNVAGLSHTVITVLIWALLFILGIEVGGNEQIIKGLHTIGIEAVILTLGSTLGSVIAAWALWKALYRKKGKTA